MNTPFFLTVDTEGDNIWDRPKNITSKNVERLYRFQELCSKYNIKPIYLTNYEACINTTFQQFTQEYDGQLEIGLHLHAWNSPPIKPLTTDDYHYQPYLHEYPKTVIKEKTDYMVKLLQDTFQTDILSHRGGRYSISETMFEALLENGIRIDCSIVPGFNMGSSQGDPDRNGGPDFRTYPLDAYKIHGELLELPVSVHRMPSIFTDLNDANLIRRILSKVVNYKNMALRSKCDNLQELKKVTNWNLTRKATHLEYIIHSSELVKGTSNLIKNDEEEELFYQNLEDFFIFLSHKRVSPMTFKEYYYEKYSDS